MNEHISKSQFQDLREKYFDRTLTDAELEQFNAYLELHSDARAALEMEARYLNTMGVLETPRLSSTENDFVAGVLEAWESEKDQDGALPPFNIKRYLQPLAFAAAAVLVGVTVWVTNMDDNNTIAPEVANVNVDITPREAKNPLSILLRETHEQYASQQAKLNQTVNAPATMLSLGNVINSLITPELPETEKTPG